MVAETLLCEIIAQGAKASAETFRSKVGYGALIHQGLVIEAGVVQSLPCDECEEPHDAEVVFEGGQYGFYCSEIGFVPVERSRLSGVQPELRKLVENIAEAFDCKRRKRTPVQGLTWRVGGVETISGELTLYFHPRLQSREDMHELEAALKREVNSPFRLILTASESISVPGVRTARLDEIFELDRTSGGIVNMSDVRAIVEAPLAKVGGRTNRFGVILNTIIQLRMRDDEALSGRNEEAKAILLEYRKRFPSGGSPSLPTIKRYLTSARSGS